MIVVAEEITITVVGNMITSLTSYPVRIATTHLAINSVLEGNYPVDKVILNLSEQEFKGQELPSELLQIDKLEINWLTRNTYTFKKVLPIVDKYQDELILCFDDDIIYPKNFVESYINTYNWYNKKHTISMNFGIEAICPFGRGTLYKPGVLKDYHYYLTDDIISCKNDDKFIDMYFRANYELAAPVLNFNQNDLIYMDHPSGWIINNNTKRDSSDYMHKQLLEFTRIAMLLRRYREGISLPIVDFDKNVSFIPMNDALFNYWNNW